MLHTILGSFYWYARFLVFVYHLPQTRISITVLKLTRLKVNLSHCAFMPPAESEALCVKESLPETTWRRGKRRRRDTSGSFAVLPKPKLSCRAHDRSVSWFRGHGCTNWLCHEPSCAICADECGVQGISPRRVPSSQIIHRELLQRAQRQPTCRVSICVGQVRRSELDLHAAFLVDASGIHNITPRMGVHSPQTTARVLRGAPRPLHPRANFGGGSVRPRECPKP